MNTVSQSLTINKQRTFSYISKDVITFNQVDGRPRAQNLVHRASNHVVNTKNDNEKIIS